MDEAIARIAAHQHGNVTRQQLAALGIDPNAIAYRRRIGRLHSVHRGVYAVGKPPVTPLERAAAAVLAGGAGALLSHGSAMTLWGFWKRWDSPLEVTIAGDRRPPGIKVHRSRTLSRRDATRQLGINVTTPARTLLDVAPRLTDRQLTRAVNDALLTPYLHRPHLAELLDRCAPHPAAARLARHAGERDGPTRSELEDEFKIFCQKHRLPEPRINARVGGYEVDALFEREQLIVELDSWGFHSSREAFEADRDRDADALAGGLPTLRVTSARVQAAPRKEARRLHKILAVRTATATIAARAKHSASG